MEKISIEFTPEDIAQIHNDWMGISLTKRQAEKLLHKIKREAEENLKEAAFGILADLVEIYRP